MMSNFCQLSLMWSGTLLGTTKMTVGRAGCTTCCIGDVATYFGTSPVIANPGSLARQLSYNASSLVIWASIAPVLPKMVFEDRQFGRNDADIRAAILDPDRAVILQVNNQSHWIVAKRRNFLGMGNDYVCADPLTGGESLALGKYHNITGAAYFRRAGAKPSRITL